eukprot:scaffold705050_cov110-Attheya_sp.AAC.1
MLRLRVNFRPILSSPSPYVLTKRVCTLSGILLLQYEDRSESIPMFASANDRRDHGHADLISPSLSRSLLIG